MKSGKAASLRWKMTVTRTSTRPSAGRDRGPTRGCRRRVGAGPLQVGAERGSGSTASVTASRRSPPKPGRSGRTAALVRNAAGASCAICHSGRERITNCRSAAASPRTRWDGGAPQAVIPAQPPDGLPSRSWHHHRRPVAIIGLGYVGLPLAISFVEAGLDVVGVDASAGRVAELRAGRSPIDDITDERLRPPSPAGSASSSRRQPSLADADVDLRLRPDADHEVEGPGPRPGPERRRADPRASPRRPADRPPVDDVPGHDDRPVPRGARARAG